LRNRHALIGVARCHHTTSVLIDHVRHRLNMVGEKTGGVEANTADVKISTFPGPTVTSNDRCSLARACDVSFSGATITTPPEGRFWHTLQGNGATSTSLGCRKPMVWKPKT
jgi:hypothetical protein